MQAPDNPDALNMVGVATFHLGDAKEALSLIETALAFDPNHTEARANFGNALRALGRLDDAEQAYRDAIALAPDHLNARFNLGVLLEISGRFPEAEQSFRKVLTLEPDHAEAHFHLGNLMKALNRLPSAIANYDAVLKSDPRHGGALTNRGAVLQEMGKPVEALDAYKRALTADPNNLDAAYNLGTLLQETGRPEEALSEYRKILNQAPDHVGAQINMAFALREMGDTDNALIAAKKAVELAPDYDKAQVNLGDLYLHMCRPADAIKTAEQYLASHPGNTSMLAFHAIALNEIGDRPALDRLLDYNRLLQPQTISAPDGFDDVATFNEALARHVRNHPSLVYAPASHATRRGRHSGELIVDPKGPVAQLEQVIMDGVARYSDALPPEPDHPFLAQRPNGLALSIWGVVMEDQGHQLAHIHPAAWLSGVYYPEIPNIIRDDDPDQQGWIEFGRPPDDFHTTAQPKITTLKPSEGLMILFPSYLYHRTIPFHAPVERLSIAFDVIPRD